MHQSTRPPLARIAAIDLAVRSGAWPNASTLGRQLEVSPRTIQRDFVFLRDRLQAPLAFDAAKNGYCYTQPDFRLPFFRLSEGEMIALFLADQVLRQYRGTPFEQDLSRAFTKISGMLPEGVSIDIGALGAAMSVKPGTVSVQEIGVFRTMADAVIHGKRLEIQYWTASRNAVGIRRVDPYHLALIDSCWYLIAYCHRRLAVLMFSAQRVRTARLTGETFDRPGAFRVDTYLGNSFRAYRGNGCFEVAVRFSAKVAGRVAEKRWHKTQVSEQTADEALVLRMRVSDLTEVKRWVLSWGADCEVVGPEELRREVREEVRRMATIYT
jgi:predicted DNA-binding transcriptional regulator YafY